VARYTRCLRTFVSPSRSNGIFLLELTFVLALGSHGSPIHWWHTLSWPILAPTLWWLSSSLPTVYSTQKHPVSISPVFPSQLDTISTHVPFELSHLWLAFPLEHAARVPAASIPELCTSHFSRALIRSGSSLRGHTHSHTRPDSPWTFARRLSSRLCRLWTPACHCGPCALSFAAPHRPDLGVPEILLQLWTAVQLTLTHFNPGIWLISPPPGHSGTLVFLS